MSEDLQFRRSEAQGEGRLQTSTFPTPAKYKRIFPVKEYNFQTDLNNVLGNSVTFDMERCRWNSMLWET